MIAVKIVKPDKELVIMTDSGMTMRMPIDQISVLGRVTQGLRLIHLRENQKVSTISLVDKSDEELTEESFDDTTNDKTQENEQ